ncbi:hypothetical protein CPB83DRAFT_842227 [Crepidotus variabilis]|uniref:Uncharacterized protein n=1 Tax=Crepidotus variabilis TaxID=179855 RepID=A0A9P6EVJ7_9AGAR|nr:hypothetical protein CPB83DRAFT_842227 [Crepidotus variabilis]
MGANRMSSHQEVELPPTLVVQPNTPPGPAAATTHFVDFAHANGHRPSIEHDSLQVPGSIHGKHYHDHHADSTPKTQLQILTALSVGAPLIASVVSSCTSVISADMTAALGADPLQRPAKASVVVALLWCALITSLGSTMTAVAGLAIHGGYHDSHVGITKRIVRFIRGRWHKETPVRDVEVHHDHGKTARSPSPLRPHSMLSAITDGHKQIHEFAAFRSAVVSARLLGTSVALLAMAMAVYLFLLYPLSVALVATVVGLVTAATTALPLLPIFTRKTA